MKMPSYQVVTTLSHEEVEALEKAREHVRLHMAFHSTWEERDRAMDAIGKVVAAAHQAVTCSHADTDAKAANAVNKDTEDSREPF